ncbi:MAG: ABC-F family ATP-binding cassette domain-containing protein [Paludibacteraceae bacterium]|nr:ABC-F family ATP-binding cassette domain-containing protein [Paludibacteraceae bacterium]MBR5824307.1 ABC-F family ATP-binding cassette domain-containing protein [Paludibacteraceae bacterium]
MISVEKLTIDFTGTPLFEEVSFLVNPKEKIALVGKNGAGKSTMLKVFAGLQQSSGGRVSMPKDFKIGYLPQHLLVNDDKTVMDEAKTAFGDVLDTQKRVERLTQELAERTDYESAEYTDLIERLSIENERLTLMGADNMMSEIERTLIGLGFLRTDFDRPTSEFSGGWRMRIELAKILLSRPDLLLLDEPTNHLDIESIRWLEQFLATSSSSLLLVSHDRAFLDAVTSRTIEISLGQIYDYKVPYTKYVELRKERREQQLRAYENQQKMIADTEEFIERFRYKATKAIQVQSRIKALDRLERIEVDLEDNSALRLKFPPAPHSGVLPVDIEHLTKAYGDHVVLNNIDLQIHRGEKVAFVGKNGEGKSTLVKCIMQEIEHSGTMKLGHGVKIGYFAQNQASLLDENLTVFDTIDYVAVGDIRTKIRDILGAFMFGGEASDKKVKVLSGGERSRLAMIKLLLEPVNLLILDEPTNHLDMRSKDVLKEAIQAFDGTVILVSHDRDFLDGLVTKVYEFGGGKVKTHLGGIEEYLQSTAGEKQLTDSEKPSTFNSQLSTPSEGRINYELRKEVSKKIRKIERDIESLEKEIEKAETRISEIEAQFAEGVTEASLLKEYEQTKHTLDAKMYEWELLSEEVEGLRADL